MRPAHRGRQGEAAAAGYLEALGFRIVGRNVRFPGGEIDLVCKDGQTLVFVEVKARTSSAFGSALTAVDARKRRKIRDMAADYAQIHAPAASIRFDVVTIEGEKLALHKGAF